MNVITSWDPIVRIGDGAELDANLLGLPLRLDEPRVIIVGVAFDLWHYRVPCDLIAAVFGVMAAALHAFVVTTEYPVQMKGWLYHVENDLGLGRWPGEPVRTCLTEAEERLSLPLKPSTTGSIGWPLMNVAINVVAEDHRSEAM